MKFFNGVMNENGEKMGDSKDNHDCPLCGNPEKDTGKPCSICGANDARFGIIKLGYLYPAEAQLIRRIFGSLLILLLITTLAIYFIFTRIDFLF